MMVCYKSVCSIDIQVGMLDCCSDRGGRFSLFRQGGCWCKPSQPCRADVLIKLFNEKKAINDITQDFGIQIDKYEKYETSEDLTADE